LISLSTSLASLSLSLSLSLFLSFGHKGPSYKEIRKPSVYKASDSLELFDLSLFPLTLINLMKWSTNVKSDDREAKLITNDSCTSEWGRV